MKQAKKITFRTHFKPGNQPIELVDSKPCETFIPNQSIKLSELVARFQRGQRLNIHVRPMNDFYANDEDVKKHSERFEDCPPSGLDDIVDIQAYSEQLTERKRELKARIKQRDELAKKKNNEGTQRKQVTEED